MKVHNEMGYTVLMNRIAIISVFLVACSGSGIDTIPQDNPAPPDPCSGHACAPEGPHVMPPQADGGSTLDSAPEASQGPTTIQSFCDIPSADPAGKPIGIQCEYFPATNTCNWTWDMGTPPNPLQPCGAALSVPVCPVGTPCHVTGPAGAITDGVCQCPPGAVQDATGVCFCPAGTQLIYGACQ